MLLETKLILFIFVKKVTKVTRMLAANYSELESDHKSCTVMALLDGGTLRRHRSWLKVQNWLAVTAVNFFYFSYKLKLECILKC